MIYLDLFLSFLQVGFFSIGGGYAAIPIIQHQVVELHPWLTVEEFTNLITIAEMTPGPIAINASTFVGITIAGPLGVLVATFACILPSCFIASFLSFIYYRYKKLSSLQSILASLRPAVVALIASAGLTILHLVVFDGGAISFANTNFINIAIFLCAMLALRKFHCNPIAVMSACGIANLAVHLPALL